MVKRVRVEVIQPERCHVCGQPIPEGQVYRRVMPVGHATGYTVGTGVGYVSLKTVAPVPLCRQHDEEEGHKVWLQSRPGIFSLLLLPIFVAWFVGTSAGLMVYCIAGKTAANIAAVGCGWLAAGATVVWWIQERLETRRRKKLWRSRNEACHCDTTLAEAVRSHSRNRGGGA
jgi:hypothetical protein